MKGQYENQSFSRTYASILPFLIYSILLTRGCRTGRLMIAGGATKLFLFSRALLGASQFLQIIWLHGMYEEVIKKERKRFLCFIIKCSRPGKASK